MLEDNYSFLRKLEHRLQILFDLQTHLLPANRDELAKLAVRMGYPSTPHRPALVSFTSDYGHRTTVNRKILDHLLHDAFSSDGTIEPEVDLVNDPEELHDLAAEPSYAATLDECRRRLYAICDPEQVDARAKARQSELLEAAGGREAVIARGDLGFTPPPGYPVTLG